MRPRYAAGHASGNADLRLLAGLLPGIGVDVLQRLAPVDEHMGVMDALSATDHIDGRSVQRNGHSHSVAINTYQSFQHRKRLNCQLQECIGY